MNSYQFTLHYDNNSDARQGATQLKSYLTQNNCPKSATTVKYNGPTVQFMVEGNVSAATFVGMLEGNNCKYQVAPIGDSQPLPTIYIHA